MISIISKINITALFVLLLFTGCKKYLEAKPDKQMSLPKTLEDLQALLDYYTKMNDNDGPAVGEASADNYYLSDIDWSGMPENYRRMYTWEKDNLFPAYPNQWSYSYDKVYTSNVVLDNIAKIERTEDNKAEWDNIKGQALCFRAKTFLDIAAVWSLAYDKSTASSDLGIPIRLNSDFNVPSVRPSMQKTYEQIIDDFKESISLLPIIPKSVFRPSRPASLALLARTYLAMREYDSAFKYADLCLQLKNDLMDYSSDPQVNGSAAYPFARLNKEVILESKCSVIAPLDNSRAKIDSGLLLSYDSNDLRKTLFFKKNSNGSYGFKGSYEEGASIFTSVATDEIYLIRAECAARAGRANQAMDDLNTLMKKRWKSTVVFAPFNAVDASDALRQVLAERRKELVMRGLRWTDIKRLNKEGAGIVLKRIINGMVYVLPTNDLRFALPIPEEVIQRSGMQQNPR